MKDLLTDPSSSASTKWLTYSGLAAAFLGTTDKANAQIVYTDVSPDTVLMQETFYVDFDGDGAYELELFQFTQSTVENFALISNAGSVVGSVTNGYLYPSVLAAGAVIAPGDPAFHNTQFATLQGNFVSSAVGQWGGQHGYIGYKFMGGDGATHYGWVELSVAEGAASMTVMAYAYEATADMAIAAGDMGVTGVDDHALLAMNVYPNPTNGKLNMMLGTTAPGTYQVSIISGIGQVLSTKQETVSAGTSTLALDMDGMAQGTYFVRVTNGRKARFTTVTKLN